MSTPLIALASILGIFALILIPLMMAKGGQQESQDQRRHDHGNQRKKTHKRK